jgi:hypothetical protein
MMMNYLFKPVMKPGSMKESELRIGNLIFDNHREIVVDVDINILRSITNNNPCLYKPIPLTEEWLLKFGFAFRKMGAGGAVFTRHNGHWYKDDIPYFAGSNGKHFDIFLQFGDGVEIQYVHQFQNLYFALTGEELEMK